MNPLPTCHILELRPQLCPLAVADVSTTVNTWASYNALMIVYASSNCRYPATNWSLLVLNIPDDGQYVMAKNKSH